MPPPSLSTTTTTSRQVPSVRHRCRPLLSWRNATSPVSRTVGAPLSATPTAVEVTPSIPLAPRLEKIRTPSRGAANALDVTDRHRRRHDDGALVGHHRHDVERHRGLGRVTGPGQHRRRSPAGPTASAACHRRPPVVGRGLGRCGHDLVARHRDLRRERVRHDAVRVGTATEPVDGDLVRARDRQPLVRDLRGRSPPKRMTTSGRCDAANSRLRRMPSKSSTRPPVTAHERPTGRPPGPATRASPPVRGWHRRRRPRPWGPRSPAGRPRRSRPRDR